MNIRQKLPFNYPQVYPSLDIDYNHNIKTTTIVSKIVSPLQKKPLITLCPSHW